MSREATALWLLVGICLIVIGYVVFAVWLYSHANTIFWAFLCTTVGSLMCRIVIDRP